MPMKSTGEPGFVVLCESPWDDEQETTKAAKYLVKKICETTGSTLIIVPSYQFQRSTGLHSAFGGGESTTRVPVCVGFTNATQSIFSGPTLDFSGSGGWAMRQEGAAVMLEGNSLENLCKGVDHFVSLLEKGEH